MTPKNRKIPKSTRFEDALGELETIVKTLESGEQSLEQSLEQFERGVSLSRFCQQSLSEAEQKVKILQENAGEENLKPFDAPD
ncbi:MAG: exodeoxyribonuclease VII small subunit [Granulosicoccus sp.]